VEAEAEEETANVVEDALGAAATGAGFGLSVGFVRGNQNRRTNLYDLPPIYKPTGVSRNKEKAMENNANLNAAEVPRNVIPVET